MGQTISQIFNRTEFAFRFGPAAPDHSRLNQDLPFVRELRSRDAVDLQAAGFQFLPVPLDVLTPIAKQREPLFLRSIPEACTNCCRH